MRRIITAVAGAVVLASTAAAQEPKDVLVQHDVIKVAGSEPKETFVYSRSVAGADTVQFVSAEATIAGKVVKGAPYSGEVVNERTQTLSDGNRITHKTTSNTYRDAEGRTRREMKLPAIGPWATQGETPTLVVINDPVANVSYHLDLQEKTARKLPVEPMGLSFAPSTQAMKVVRRRDASADVKGEVAGEAPMAVGVVMSTDGPGEPKFFNKKLGEPKFEALGKQAIDGVEAEGKRTTMTIPAGEIGNDREINVINETWYSSELQTTIMTKHSDPRMGETTMKLTNIHRGDPHPSLFQVPSDFKIEEGEAGVRTIRRFEK